MSWVEAIIYAVCFAPVWIPMLIALLGRREAAAIRVVMGVSGTIAAIYAAVAFWVIEGGAGGRVKGFELLVIPFRAAIVSFYLAFTGVCFVTTAEYWRRGRVVSLPGLIAAFCFSLCVAGGVLFGGRLLAWSN